MNIITHLLDWLLGKPALPEDYDDIGYGYGDIPMPTPQERLLKTQPAGVVLEHAREDILAGHCEPSSN